MITKQQIQLVKKTAPPFTQTGENLTDSQVYVLTS